MSFEKVMILGIAFNKTKEEELKKYLKDSGFIENINMHLGEVWRIHEGDNIEDVAVDIHHAIQVVFRKHQCDAYRSGDIIFKEWSTVLGRAVFQCLACKKELQV